MTASVRMTLQWLVTPQESGAVTAALHDMMVAARTQPGCLGCRLSTEMGQKAGLKYVEEWRNEGDLKRQLRSDRFARLAELVERATEQPQVEFQLATAVRGLDYAEEVRRGQGEGA